jgi:hypothetical protein
MFIQAVDNKLYQNPSIEGKNYIIKFDDEEDEGQVFLEYNNNSTLTSSRKRIREIFKKIFIKAKLDVEGIEDVFVFPQKGNKLVKCARFGFFPKERIPVPDHFDSVVTYPSIDSNYLAWELPFDYRTIQRFLNGSENNPILIKFLMGKDIIEVDKKTYQRAVLNLVKCIKMFDVDNKCLILCRR